MSSIGSTPPRSATLISRPADSPALMLDSFDSPKELGGQLGLIQLLLEVAAVAAIIFLAVIKLGSAGTSGTIVCIFSVIVSSGLLLTAPTTMTDSWLNTSIIILFLLSMLCYKHIALYWLSIVLAVLTIMLCFYALFRSFLYSQSMSMARMLVLLGAALISVYLMVTTIYY